jgi:hypothetical protein
MRHAIVIEEHSGQRVVRTTIRGTMTETVRDTTAKATLDAARANGIRHVLWDLRDAELAYPLIASHVMVKNLGRLGVEAEDSVAILYRNNAEQHEHAKTVAANRGITNVAYFKDAADAIAWLLAR